MEQKFTQMAQEALSDAVQNAAALGNPQVDTLHLLDAMLRQENIFVSFYHSTINFTG